MKRSPALQQLSREHHPALVLASRIAKAGDAVAVDELLRRVPEVFARELAPHFAQEEAMLLPRLAAAGAGDLVARTLDEHRRMYELLAAIETGDGTALKVFGELLQAHVRFEERELFVAAEALLPADFLAGSAAAVDDPPAA